MERNRLHLFQQDCVMNWFQHKDRQGHELRPHQYLHSSEHHYNQPNQQVRWRQYLGKYLRGLGHRRYRHHAAHQHIHSGLPLPQMWCLDRGLNYQPHRQHPHHLLAQDIHHLEYHSTHQEYLHIGHHPLPEGNPRSHRHPCHATVPDYLVEHHHARSHVVQC